MDSTDDKIFDSNYVRIIGEDEDLPMGTLTVTVHPDDRGTLIIGPWDEPYTAYQRALYGAMEWLARAGVAYEPESLFEVRLFGGAVRVLDNGDVVLHIGPLSSAVHRVFEWLWDKGLP